MMPNNKVENKNSSEEQKKKTPEWVYQIFVAFICIYSYMVIYEISYTSLDYAKAFKIPKENVDLYLSQIDTYRTVFMIFGSTVAHYLNYYFVNISNYFTTTAFIILFMIRFAFLVLIYMPCTLTIHVFRIFNVEAFVFGFLQICIFAFVPHYTSIILLSNDFSRIFVFICQALLCLTEIKSIDLIKMLWYISIVMGLIPLGMICFYFFDSDKPFLATKKIIDKYKTTTILTILRDILLEIYSLFYKMKRFKYTHYLVDQIKLMNDLKSDIKNIRSIKFPDNCYEVKSGIENICNEIEILCKLEGIISIFRVIKRIGCEQNEKDNNKELNKEVALIQKVESKEKTNCFKTLIEYLNYSKQLLSDVKSNDETGGDQDQYKLNENQDLDKIKILLSDLLDKYKTNNTQYNQYDAEKILKILNIQKYYDLEDKLEQNLSSKDKNKDFVIIIENKEIYLRALMADKINQILKKIGEVKNVIIESDIKEAIVCKKPPTSSQMDIPNSPEIEENKRNSDDLYRELDKLFIDFLTYLDEINKNNEYINIKYNKKMIKTISPFMMVFVASFFKEFLYAGVTPYGLLDPKDSLILIRIIPFAFLIGSVTVFIIDKFEITLKRWKWYYHFVWLLVAPMIIIFISALLSIHTKIPFFSGILNSQTKVYSMTITLIICYSLLVCFSYVGVANHVCYQSNTNESISLLTCQNIMAIFLSYFFFKLSVGYNSSRVTYGYTLPNFQPARNSKNTIIFWIWETIKCTFKDIIADFRNEIISV